MTRRLRAAALAGFYFIFLISCSEKEPYVFGFVSSLSGPNSDLGAAGRNGVLLAVEEYNDKGGIHGRQIEIVIKDHQMDSAQLSHISGVFADAGIEIVIGPFTSEMTKAILPIADAGDLIILSPTASSKEFLNLDDNLIRLNSSTLENTQYYADFLIKEAALMSCAVLYDNQNESFTKSWLNDFTRNYEKLGGRIVIAKYFNAQLDTDFTPELESVLNSGAETLLIIGNSIDSATLIQQLRHIDHTFPVTVSEWAGTKQFIELGGKAVEGAIVLQSFNPFDESESYRQFYNRYLERFQSEPTFAAIMSHDACHVLFQALNLRIDEQTIKTAIIENGPYEGIQETIVINSFGDTKRKAVFSVVKNGQFRKIE
ncbi:MULTISPECIES: ABC transporter substrate-binding protein [unclassified Oceanispirochaeta]|uniref:ABC transporter substrate-binding protein n=1 Tax=unclassified Oceanispirochaeta TaxID=2635722 RepID=UPI000E099073|nr:MULTISPECIES: ABC transporter substrate-binding protein [unclassified Oceanispirochaeta]MBF9017068.1 ABC transporter substrate-binding protein [Oceanispirochaeta sp. M2]NPD73517.1 amino acid ABC transporter substrate-binding protein [Oceanispirochaeta sp. M1]RDG30807.1 amino acid ABC transporter substrate-binding protein [Oceanispirochaeta sp. M1]